MINSVIIFDLDGTLVNTVHVDEVCFKHTLSRVFGFPDIDSSSFINPTDSGIIYEMFERHKNRLPNQDELSLFIDTFCDSLTIAYKNDKIQFEQLAHADEVLDHLNKSSDILVGIATGGWKRSATMKLNYGGVDVGDIPFSTAENGISKSEIIGNCIDEIKKMYRLDFPYYKVLYVGDSAWDYKATQELGVRFLGIENSRLRDLNDIDKISTLKELYVRISQL